MNPFKLRKFKRPAFFILFFALLAAFLLFSKSFSTSGDVLPMAVWQDQGGQATFAQVIAAERDSSSDSVFSRKEETGFSGGYTNDAFWFKLTLPASSEPTRIYLEVQPTYLDYVSLYWPDDQGHFQERHLGDRVAFSNRAVHSRGFVFPVDVSASEKTAYLRLKTSSSSLILVKAWQRDAFHQKNQHDYFLFALLFGLGISLIFFNSLQMVGQKSFMYYAFIFFLVVQVSAIFVINGFASEFLFPHHPEIDSAFVGVVTMLLLMTISLGHYFFLRLSWQETPILFSLTWGGILLSVVGIIGAILGFYVKTTPLIGLYTIMLYVSGLDWL